MLSLLLPLVGLVSLLETGLEPAMAPARLDRIRNAAVVVHRQPEVPLVALRLSVLAYDPPGYAGAGHMIQHMLYPGLRDRAARVGSRIEIQRTSDAIVYTAIGPSSELEFLAQLLVSTLEPPRAQTDGVLRAERELREERLAEWETAPAHARSMLRAQVFPFDLSSTGTDRSATRFTPSSLPDIWAHMYRPDLVSVVAVGDVHLTAVERAFADLPPARELASPGIQRDSVILTSLAPAQATRAWLGRAYSASGLSPAAVTVAGRLIENHIREQVPGAQVDVEHWWTHHGQALAIITAAPQAQSDVARRIVDGAVATTLETLTESRVLAAATAIRREMLFYSRTPDRMADVLGQFIDRDGDVDAAERFYSDLDRIDESEVESILEALMEDTPAEVAIPPQSLLPRRR